MNLETSAHLTPAESVAVEILTLIGLVLLFFSVRFFGKSFALAKRGEGKIAAPHFQTPALIAALALFVFLMTISIPELFSAESQKAVKFFELLANLLLLVGIEATILLVALVILKWQHTKIRELLGFSRMKFSRAIFTGIGLLAFAYPLIALGRIALSPFFSDKAKQEDAVQIFMNGDHASSLTMIVFGVCVAPVLEELIFRAFLYPALKQFVGFLPSLFLCSALFALVHTTPAALLPLFIFAILQTLAYERFGSIFVPIATHAAFNASQFVLLIFFTKMSPGL